MAYSETLKVNVKSAWRLFQVYAGKFRVDWQPGAVVQIQDLEGGIDPKVLRNGQQMEKA